MLLYLPLSGDLSLENMAVGKAESETDPEGYLFTYRHGTSFDNNFHTFYRRFLGK